MSVPRAPHAWMSNGVTAEPRPIDSNSTPRRTPSARPIRRGGITCCSELYTPTSSKTLATPIAANIRYGQYSAWANASRIIGTPHPATPPAKLRATLLPRTSRTASGPTRRPPTPSSAVSQPTAAEPRSNTSRAMTTVRTLRTPRANVWAAAGTNSATASRRRTPASKPATMSSLSCFRRPVACTGASDESGRTPASSTAATATSPQATSMADRAVLIASRAAAIAGPPTMAADCSTLAAVFALVSSSGVRASQGSRAACT